MMAKVPVDQALIGRREDAPSGDVMELRAVDPDVHGREYKDTESLRQAMVSHKADARLFAD